MKRLPYIVLLLLVTFQPLLSHGLEFRVTLSGKLLLGIAYRYQIDANTAIRTGAYTGFSGAPVGFHLGMVQDISPSKEWTPFFEVSGDMIFFKKNDKIVHKLYPSGSVGLTYCPTTTLKHSAELWLGWLSGSLNPVGLRYVHYNSVN